MFALLRKEISSFFSNLTGYVVIIVFLTVNALFMWIFKGDLNILESGYANMDALFRLGPWVFLFLVPAITMKLFAEEKQEGTVELLLTHPLSERRIIMAKYLGAVSLVFLALVPTGIYYLSVYLLGSPPGNLDTGAIMGSYLGLLLLGSAYAAAGIFISSLTDNQIVSFIATVLICFLLFTGFDMIASLDLFGSLGYAVMKMGINEHYISIRRGVVDTRDLVYFLSLITLFLVLTGMALRGWRITGIRRGAWTLVLVVIVNIISNTTFRRLDLTAEKRYTVSSATREVLGQLEEVAHVEVFLNGELPVGFERLRTAIQEILDEFRIYAGGNVNYRFTDPAGDPRRQRELFNELVNKGLQPTNAQIVQKDGSTMQKILFPGALITYRGIEVPLNLLKNNMGLPGETNLQNSIQALEYEFTIMLRNLSSDTIEKIAFLEGHGELDALQTWDITRSLSRFYQVDRGPVRGRTGILDTYRAVIIAGPTRAFPEEDKYVIDQYIMQGGRVLWLLDPVRVSLDSARNGSTVAFYAPVNLEDMLFRYGTRINPNLVQDIQCHVIPVSRSVGGLAPSVQVGPWYYYPVVSPGNGHIITRALNMLWFRFASVIDTVGLDPEVEKTVLLTTSPYTRIVPVPAEISLRETDTRPSESAFNRPPQSLAVLLEGNFKSVFVNRPLPGSLQGAVPGFLDRSRNTRMIVVSDADLIANEVIESTGGPVPAPLGYDAHTNTTFGNTEFIVNCINYLTRQTDLMSLRGREFRLRLLDRQRTSESEDFWKMFNSLAPALIVILTGLGIWIIRVDRWKKWP